MAVGMFELNFDFRIRYGLCKKSKYCKSKNEKSLHFINVHVLCV